MKQFPIMLGFRGTPGPCPSAIPWEAIAPYEGAALVNHEQTLEKLASRGGLDPVEAYFVMTGKTWHNVSTPVTDDLKREACAFLDGIVKDKIRVERDALLPQIETLTTERDQWKNASCYKKVPCGHCNCYQDIDYDFPGCSWCVILKENVETANEVTEANRLNQELQNRLGQLNDFIEKAGLSLQVPPIPKATEKRNDGLQIAEARNLPYPKPISNDAAKREGRS